MKKKNLAFTLAEVLIVIGIIGVVAALTLPNLNHATGDKETVTRLKKIYSTLSEAFDRAQAIYGPVSEWWNSPYSSCNEEKNNWDEAKCSTFFTNRIIEFLKVTKEDNGIIQVIYLPDGSMFYLEIKGQMKKSGHYPGTGDNIYYGYIWVGLDKRDDTIGKSWFQFDVTDDGIYPSNFENYDNSCLHQYEHFCTRWVIENENLDYLKADENGVCPNGVQLGDGVYSCS